MKDGPPFIRSLRRPSRAVRATCCSFCGGGFGGKVLTRIPTTSDMIKGILIMSTKLGQNAREGDGFMVVVGLRAHTMDFGDGLTHGSTVSLFLMAKEVMHGPAKIKSVVELQPCRSTDTSRQPHSIPKIRFVELVQDGPSDLVYGFDSIVRPGRDLRQ